MDQISERRRETSDTNHNKIQWVTAYGNVSKSSHQRISGQSVEKLLTKFSPYGISADAMLSFQRMMRVTVHEWMR